MLRRDFNKVTLELYCNHFLAWVFSWKFAAYFQNTFSKNRLQRAASAQSELECQGFAYTKPNEAFNQNKVLLSLNRKQ